MRRDRGRRSRASKPTAKKLGQQHIEPTEDPPKAAFDLLDPRSLGDRLRFLHRAVVQGWEIRQDWMEQIPTLLEKIANDETCSVRDRMKAVDILRAMASDRIEATKSIHAIAKDLHDRTAQSGGQSTGVKFTFEVTHAPGLGVTAGPATEVRYIEGS